MAEAEPSSGQKNDDQLFSFSNTSLKQRITQKHADQHATSDTTLIFQTFDSVNGTYEEDRISMSSQDSGIPTLEINPPEHIHARATTAERVIPPHDDKPATLNLEISEGSLIKASTFPRCDFDFVRLHAPNGLSSAACKGTLNRSDDFSVCSVSSLSTEFSTTLSVSNEDFLDFMVTSESSAVVTFENEDALNRFDHSLSPPSDFHKKLSSPQRPSVEISTPKETRSKTPAPLISFFHRNLPAKPEEEAQKHRQEYEEMVAQAKKRELKEAQKRKKQLEDRCKLEESIGNAALTWSQEILPNWQSMCSSKRVRDLWWQGLPPSVRGKVWSLAIGNDLNITDELYNICLSRAKEKWNTFVASTSAAETDAQDAGLSLADREASLELIKLDISRTFPHLCIFQEGGPYHDVLHSILGAYTCYRPDVGYVQGMSFIAAVLILNMDTADAFIAFTNLLNKPCQMAFYRVDHSLMLTYFAAFEVFFEENLPKLFAHFKENNLSSDIYLIDWIFTLYSKSLPLDIACRVWDVFCRDGEEFLFRTALGILRLYEDILTHMDFIHIAQFLTRLPDDISADEIFSSVTTVNMNCRNKRWPQVLQSLLKGQDRSSPLLKR
ncbi:hypothetical protein DNTS_018057 [Danionella cerebrum]|uniref:Rab-GAP TBC domain-containing protein n=1 Tax=Danionella cerebrum TaxID=2873325 RepID=A0A553RBU2_9TELE|nr:hypothetical protein DNTS_018057 [Danionella translucida]